MTVCSDLVAKQVFSVGRRGVSDFWLVGGLYYCFVPWVAYAELLLFGAMVYGDLGMPYIGVGVSTAEEVSRE